MKLSHDPNNTKWTSDTASFGRKIMKSQGWEPGQYLGAKDANQAEHYTAANASHIRVAIKDDNLGIGAKIGSGVGHGECTGLDAFKNLLGRLNGKDEDELEKEQKSREDLRRAIYTEKRWGSVRFVPGGFLIGDKIQHLIDSEAERIRKLALGASDDSSGSSDSSSSSSESEEEPEPVKVSKKKRKIEIMEEHESDAAIPVKVSKKKRKAEIEKAEPEVVAIKVKTSKKKRKSDAKPEDAEEVAAAMEDTKMSKKSKKERKALAEAEVEDTQDDAEIKKRKREKKDKKDRKEREEKARFDEEDPAKESKKKKSKRDKHKIKEEDGSTESSRVATKESTPSMTPLTIDSGRSTPMMQGRHAVRSRNIAQKRLASMDVASLNQVSHFILNPRRLEDSNSLTPHRSS
jgi:Pin2-interacting protein X1